MNFDNIQLPSSLIADLYRHSLVVLDGEQLPAIIPAQPKTAAPQMAKPEEKPVQPAILEPASAAPLPEPSAMPAIHYVGGFKQQVSVVIRDERNKDIAPADLEFLKKLMAACKLTLDDLAVINVHSNQPQAQQLWQLMPAKAVLMFGVGTNDVGIPFYRPDFQVQHWDGAVFMNVPPLAAFQGPDSAQLKALKRELWEGLQKMFLGK